MTKPEPAWLTAIFTIVGFFIITMGAAAAFAIVAYWPLFVAVSFAFAVYYWWTKSAWGLERAARNRTHLLLKSLRDLDLRGFPTSEEFSLGLLRSVLKDRDPVPLPQIFAHMQAVAEDLYEIEKFTARLGEPPLIFNSIEGARYRELIERTYNKLADERALNALGDAIHAMLDAYMDGLPPSAMQPRD